MCIYHLAIDLESFRVIDILTGDMPRTFFIDQLLAQCSRVQMVYIVV